MASGKAGRTDYAQWDKVTNSLLAETEQEEKEEIEKEKKALGLDGKYARSEAEAEERKKAKEILKAKETLDAYKEREKKVKSDFVGLLGPVVPDGEEVKSSESTTVRITRDMVDAGKRVVSISDTSGSSQNDTIVFTQDLSLLESKMAVGPNSQMKPKSYEGDAENSVPEEKTQHRTIYGLIKAFISNVHNCTILLKCKIISGTIEISHCSNVVICIHQEATVPTIQLDLCENVTLDFKDAPSNKNTAMLPGQKKIYWGEDRDDRIFHAGVKNMNVRIWKDAFMETETTADYIKDGAETVGNASPEEFQFVTSVVDGKLLTEKVVRAGATTGSNARIMTQRELDSEKVLREKAAAMAIQKAEEIIKFQEKVPRDPEAIKQAQAKKAAAEKAQQEIMEVYTSMSPEKITQIVQECELNKKRGNEAFVAGEYGQAILLYSLALDKSDELPDKENRAKDAKPLFPRDLVYSNRAACFLKLGQHEKALEDAKQALVIQPTNIKAKFRQGLSLHAMGRYSEALPILAAAHKQEPKNRQIKEALQFCEVRLTQEMRKRSQG